MSEKYNPAEYWNTREHPNTAEAPGINHHEIDFLGPKLAEANSVLELGPGIGRLFPLYKEVAETSTLDLSTNYDERARAAATASGVAIDANFIDDPLAKFPFADNTFDLGIASHVLMHIPFENISHSMSEMARCCKSVAVISAIHRYWPRKGAEYDPKWHCFAHDYEAICKDLGCTFAERTTFAERELDGSFGFVFSKTA